MPTDPRIRYDIQARASGAADVEKLAQEFEKLDGAFPDDLAGKVRNASQQLEQLGQQQQAVEAFSRIKTETEQARKALDEAQAAAQKFGRELAQTEAPTRAQAGQLEKLKDNVKAAKDELLQQTQALDQARAGLTQFGLSGDQAGQRTVALRQQIAAVRSELANLTSAGASGAGFQTLVRETDAARQRMEETARAADALSAQLQAVQRPTDGEAAKLRELRAAADVARSDFERLQAATVEQGLALRQAGVNTELLTAKTREAAAAQQQASAAAQRGATAYTEQGTAAQRAAAQQTAAATNVRQGLDGIAGQLRSIQALAATVLGGQLLSGSIGDIARTADAYANLEARIKLVTGEGAALTNAFNGVFDVALRTNSAVEGTGTLFARIAQAGKDLGLSTSEAAQQALQLTETINQAIQVSGGSAQSADAAVTQLIQGLQSGVLRGEEFNSVMEQAPRLARALADGLGVTTGQLRKLAEAGTLTSATVINSLQGQSEALKREFEQLPPTVGRALQTLSVEWTRYVGEVDRANGVSRSAAEAITSLARNLDTVGAALSVAGKAAAAYLAIDLAKSLYSRAAAAAAAAAAQQTETAAVAGSTTALGTNTAALVANTAAKASNTAATAANGAANAAGALAWGSIEKNVRLGGVAAAEAATKTGALGTAFGLARGAGSALLGAIGGLPTVLLGVALNAREIGTWIGESAAKMLGAKDRSEELAKADEELARRSREVAAAKAAQAQAAQLAADKALGLTDASKRLVAEFDELTKKGKSSADALKEIERNLDFSSPKGIQDAIIGLQALEKQGKVTGDQIRESVQRGLNGIDLSTFRINAMAAFDGTAEGAERLKLALDGIASESLKRVGTSAEELETGFSKTFTRAINDVDVLEQTLQEMGVGGEKAGELLSKSLDQALSAANTEEAIKALIDRLEQLGKAGKISGEQLTDGLTKARTKLDELKPGINSTEEAYRKLGITSRAEAQKTADAYGQAYKKIAQDAQATLTQKIEAFKKWSAAAIEANGGVITSEVKLQREILNAQARAAGLGDVLVDAMDRSRAAIDLATNAADALAGSLSSVYDEATKARKAADLSVLGNVDSNGFTLGADGQRFTVNGQVQVPEGYTFDNAAFQRAQRAAALSGTGAPNPANFYKAPSLGLGEITDAMAAELGLISGGSAGYNPLGANRQRAELEAKQREAAARAAPSGTSGTGSAPASSSNVQIIRLQIGNTSTDVRVASSNDAAALTAFLNQLAAAARSAGINLSGP